MSEYKLIEEILGLSTSPDWDDAKKEWKLTGIRMASVPERCLCGHFPIVEVCTITNVHDGTKAEVGNYCVKKFIGLPSDRIFDAIKRVQSDRGKALNIETLDYALEQNWITAKDHKFYVDTMRKRALTEKQGSYREGLNRKILRHFKMA